MHEIPRHLTWMEQTAGGVFDRRNPLLKEVDDAILAYDRGGRSAALKDAIRLKLDAYLWHDLADKSGVAVMESGDIEAVFAYLGRWNPHMEVTVRPVLEDAEAAAVGRTIVDMASH